VSTFSVALASALARVPGKTKASVAILLAGSRHQSSEQGARVIQSWEPLRGPLVY
jgi:hypothetical protein